MAGVDRSKENETEWQHLIGRIEYRAHTDPEQICNRNRKKSLHDAAGCVLISEMGQHATQKNEYLKTKPWTLSRGCDHADHDSRNRSEDLPKIVLFLGKSFSLSAEKVKNLKN